MKTEDSVKGQPREDYVVMVNDQLCSRKVSRRYEACNVRQSDQSEQQQQCQTQRVAGKIQGVIILNTDLKKGVIILNNE